MFKLCWHKWSKWGKPFQFGYGDGFQNRVCLKCGKVQQRKAGWIVGSYNEGKLEDYYEYDFDKKY
jgi:hypothetical protein